MTALLSLTLLACSSERAAQKARTNERLTGTGIAVFAAGDIADCAKRPARYSGAAKTAALVQAELDQDPQAVAVTLGDNSYPIGLLSEFVNCYDPTWGRFKSRTHPSSGNHEYNSPEAAGYYRYFGEQAGPAGLGYYSFNLGKWHVVSLNSNLRGEAFQAQLDWLGADLKAHPSLCSLAYWHHPMYSSGWHGDNSRLARMWTILQENGVDLALTSHDHVYERFAPLDGDGKRDDKGIRQFVVGTGGAKLTPFALRRSPNSEVSDNSTLGVLKLTLKDNGYQWEFLPVENGGFSDQGASLCH